MQCPTPLSIKDPTQKVTTMMTVPCGKCGACRHNRRSSWSFRLQQESRYSRWTNFVTLTYADENLPFTTEGEITLDKSHLQKFKKKIRKAQAQITDKKIRYYSVGEYGTETGRPHYHSILFNLHPDIQSDLVNHWTYGHIHCGSVTQASIHYVSKFHTNAVKDPDDIQPEFATMSRRPGIGHKYIDQAKSWHRENEYTHVVCNGFKQNIPRYYREKIFSQEERKRLAEQTIYMSDEQYDKEIQRLKDLNVKDPDRDIFKSQLNQAKKVLDKNSQGNLF